MNKNRVRWDCIYTNPTEISRQKWYEFKVEDNKVLVYGDGKTLDYTLDQFKEFFIPEIGKIEDLFKKEVAVEKKEAK